MITVIIRALVAVSVRRDRWCPWRAGAVPADDASRGGSPVALAVRQRWAGGRLRLLVGRRGTPRGTLLRGRLVLRRRVVLRGRRRRRWLRRRRQLTDVSRLHDGGVVRPRDETSALGPRHETSGVLETGASAVLARGRRASSRRGLGRPRDGRVASAERGVRTWGGPRVVCPELSRTDHRPNACRAVSTRSRQGPLPVGQPRPPWRASGNCTRRTALSGVSRNPGLPAVATPGVSHGAPAHASPAPAHAVVEQLSCGAL